MMCELFGIIKYNIDIISAIKRFIENSVRMYIYKNRLTFIIFFFFLSKKILNINLSLYRLNFLS